MSAALTHLVLVATAHGAPRTPAPGEGTHPSRTDVGPVDEPAPGPATPVLIVAGGAALGGAWSLRRRAAGRERPRDEAAG